MNASAGHSGVAGDRVGLPTPKPAWMTCARSFVQMGIEPLGATPVDGVYTLHMEEPGASAPADDRHEAEPSLAEEPVTLPAPRGGQARRSRRARRRWSGGPRRYCIGAVSGPGPPPATVMRGPAGDAARRHGKYRRGRRHGCHPLQRRAEPADPGQAEQQRASAGRRRGSYGRANRTGRARIRRRGSGRGRSCRPNADCRH